jgi:hypothetical protein
VLAERVGERRLRRGPSSGEPGRRQDHLAVRVDQRDERDGRAEHAGHEPCQPGHRRRVAHLQQAARGQRGQPPRVAHPGRRVGRNRGGGEGRVRRHAGHAGRGGSRAVRDRP